MTYTVGVAKNDLIDQQTRNQMSLMALFMAFLCGWVMFLSARAVVGAQHDDVASDADKKVVATTGK